jgi:hypothetical protein
VAAAVAFVYSSYVGLYFQLLILAITCIMGTLSFWLVAWKIPIDHHD